LQIFYRADLASVFQIKAQVLRQYRIDVMINK